MDYLIKEGWPKERAHYIPNFVDPTRAEPLSRQKYNTPEKAPLILCLGRLHKNKAFDVVIKALKDVPKAYLWIAGEGELRGELETLAREMGVADRVRFIGWHQDARPLQSAADIICCPSRHEPLGNVVLEAWAQEKPIVAAASQGPSSLIKTGKNGILTPLEDVAAMAKGLNEVINSKTLAKKMVAEANKDYQNNFSEDVVVEKYLDFFSKITGEKSKKKVA